MTRHTRCVVASPDPPVRVPARVGALMKMPATVVMLIATKIVAATAIMAMAADVPAP